jgi:hypothetical protein
LSHSLASITNLAIDYMDFANLGLAGFYFLRVVGSVFSVRED